MIYLLSRERSKDVTSKVLICWISVVVLWCICGAFRCDDYWDWKSLIQNVFAYGICIASFTFSNPTKLSLVLGFWFKHAWKYLIFIIPFMNEDGITKSLCPYMMLACFYPIIGSKYKRHVIVVLLIYLIFAIGARTDNLKLFFCVCLGVFSQCLRPYKRHSLIIKQTRIILLVMPFVFLILASSGVFNVFRFQDYLRLDETRFEEAQLADTRTNLYEEVIESVSSHNRVLVGETPAKGYESAWFARNFDQSDIMGINHYGWRGNTESSVLNVFMHFGLIGLFVYYLVFYYASYYGVYKSNNIFIPVISIFVAFRWAVGWIEDFTRFDLNMLMLWILIGMCFSKEFREMSNDEFKQWISKMLYK